MNELDKTVHFNEEIIIIEYDANERIRKKDSFIKHLIKIVINLFKRT